MLALITKVRASMTANAPRLAKDIDALLAKVDGADVSLAHWNDSDYALAEIIKPGDPK